MATVMPVADLLPDSQQLRNRMVERQIARRGIIDQRVLDAMRRVPREAFVPANMQRFAYDDGPLPIGEGQTISQPYIVAFMIQSLALGSCDNVLDVGTGTGYAAAVIGHIARTVHTIERLPKLAGLAQQRFDDLGYDNIVVHEGDGTRGLPAHAPYDAINVGAGGCVVPRSLQVQLRIGGRLLIPVGETREYQQLILERRMATNTFEREALIAVRFVPLRGEAGWN